VFDNGALGKYLGLRETR